MKSPHKQKQLQTVQTIFGDVQEYTTIPYRFIITPTCPHFSEPAPSHSAEPIFRSAVSIKYNYSAFYPLQINPDYHQERSKVPKFSTARPDMSAKARTRIKNTINWMLFASGEKWVPATDYHKRFCFRLSFITLTLSEKQKHDDLYIKEHLLQPFLLWMQRHHSVLMYVWKAESQDIGNIHFHITTHVYIPWKAIRKKWNKLLAAHGYCKVQQDGANDKGDAATQIKAVKNETEIATYIANYLGKKDVYRGQFLDFMEDAKKKKVVITPDVIGLMINAGLVYKREIQGKLWGCSETLSKVTLNLDDTEVDMNEIAKTITEGNNSRNLQKVLQQKDYQALEKNPNKDALFVYNEKLHIAEKYSELKSVYLHDPLDKMNLPESIRLKLAGLRMQLLGGVQEKTKYTLEEIYRKSK